MAEDTKFLPDDVYRFVGMPLYVRSNSQEVLDYLRSIYGRFYIPSSEPVFHQTNEVQGQPSPVVEVIDRIEKDRGLRIRDEFESFTLQCEDLFTLCPDDPRSMYGVSYPLAHIQWVVLRNVSLRARDHHLIHAGAVSWGNQAVIFPAVADSGKTTLSLSLVRQGFKLLSDEIACLDRNRSIVEPFPRTARFDERSRQLLGIHPSTAAKAPHTEGEDTQWLVDVEDVFSPDSCGPALLRYIVFLRGFGETSRLEPISQTAALLELFKLNFGRPENTMEALFEYAPRMKGVRCFKLIMGDLNEATHVIRSLVDDACDIVAEGCVQ